MVELTRVSKTYGTSRGVENISFSIQPGSLVGLLGPNGAGKTTIMKIITGYHFPSSGTVKIGGFDPVGQGVQVKGLIGYLPENTPIYGEMLVQDYLRFIAETRLPRQDIPQAIKKAADLVGISDILGRRIHQLSKGYKQRVGLAQAIIHDPPILILDEPTSGLDPNQIIEIRKLIKVLGKEKTIILSTHILQEVEALCDRVLILNNGTIAAEGNPRDIARTLQGGARIKLRFTLPGKTISDTLEISRQLTEFLHIPESSWTLEGDINPSHNLINSKSRGNIFEFHFSSPPDMNEDDASSVLAPWLSKNGAVILSLTQSGVGLEELFNQLTASADNVVSPGAHKGGENES